MAIAVSIVWTSDSTWEATLTNVPPGTIPLALTSTDGALGTQIVNTWPLPCAIDVTQPISASASVVGAALAFDPGETADWYVDAGLGAGFIFTPTFTPGGAGAAVLLIDGNPMATWDIQAPVPLAVQIPGGVHTLTILAASGAGFSLNSLSSTIIVLNDSRPRSTTVQPQKVNQTILRAEAVTAQQLASTRRAARLQAKKTDTVRRAGSITPWPQIRTIRRSSKASQQTVSYLRAVVVYEGVASDPVDFDVILVGTEAPTRRSGTVTPSGDRTSRRSGSADNRYGGSTARAVEVDGQAKKRTRRSGSPGDLGQSITIRVVATYGGVDSDPVYVSVSSLGFGDQTRRASKTAPAFVGTGRRGAVPGSPVVPPPIVAADRRASTASPQSLRQGRRSTKTNISLPGVEQRSGAAFPAVPFRLVGITSKAGKIQLDFSDPLGSVAQPTNDQNTGVRLTTAEQTTSVSVNVNLLVGEPPRPPSGGSGSVPPPPSAPSAGGEIEPVDMHAPGGDGSVPPPPSAPKAGGEEV
jgi:hypothetical protein